MKVGERAGAMLSANANEVKLLGYGVYAGDFVPVDAKGMGALLAEAECKNPRIDLDDGGHVWGCECWWGPEEQVRKRVAAFKDAGAVIVNATIDRDQDSE